MNIITNISMWHAEYSGIGPFQNLCQYCYDYIDHIEIINDQATQHKCWWCVGELRRLAIGNIL